jgi:diphthine synthase
LPATTKAKGADGLPGLAGGARTGELHFVGLGLHDDTDMSVAGLEVAQKADRIFAEFYTSHLSGATVEVLEGRIEREIEVLDREAVEQAPDLVLDAAEGGSAVLLVAGDPMAATTHIDLRLRAEARGIRTRVFHGASILTAAFTELGLSLYKSGRVTTLQWPAGSYFPTSPYEMIMDNKMADLHSLVLLDIRADEERYMTAAEGCQLLLRYDAELGGGVTGPDALACVVARAGAPDCQRVAGRLGDLAGMDFGAPLHAIVVPGKLHFVEAEALTVLAGADPELVGGED